MAQSFRDEILLVKLSNIEAYDLIFKFLVKSRDLRREIGAKIEDFSKPNYIKIGFGDSINLWNATISFIPEGDICKLKFNFNFKNFYILWIVAITLISAFSFLMSPTFTGLIMMLLVTPFFRAGYIKQKVIMKVKGLLDTLGALQIEREDRSPEKLYERLLESYRIIYGKSGEWTLEKRIRTFTGKGLSREEAIEIVAKEEGIT